MDALLEKIQKIGIVPVIKIDDVEKAVPLAKALVAGGIPCAEVTFRTAQAEEAIRRISAEVPEILVGAGTVLTTEQVDKAAAAGAKFMVSPGLNPKIVSYCKSKGILILPGCANPSDMEAALDLGLEVVKFFPAEQAGGLSYIKAVSAPYTSLKFMPTGGVNAANLGGYLAFERIIACGGSWMVSADLIDSGNFDEITRLCKEALRTMFDFQFAHMGINAANKEASLAAAKRFELLFGLAVKEGNSSNFASDKIEIMNQQGYGTHGHIGISTPQLERAIAYFEAAGFTFLPDSIKQDTKGNITLIYFAEEVAGFAVHLVKRK